MDPEDAREIITARRLDVPYSIVTRGGETYPVVDHANIFIPAAYPNTFVLAIPRQGIAWLGLGSIDAIRAEHEPVADGAR